MQTNRSVEKTDKNGMLALRIPIGRPEAEFAVLVVVEPRVVQTPTTENGWPVGFFDRMFGCVDETFERPPQGVLPPIECLE